MSRHKAIIAAAVAAVLLLAVVFYWLHKRRLARLTAEAPAQVTSVYVERNRRRSGNSRRTETETKITYRYAVGGRTLEGSSTKDGDQSAALRAGARTKVCYNPSAPDESEVFTPDHVCGR
jgi:hypothetical protein